MLRSILISLVLFCTLQAQTLDELINNSLKKHNSIKAIEMRLSSLEESVALSRKFQNPTLSLSISDIQFQDPQDRSLEPMQATSINLQQKIPYFGKRDALESLAVAKKSVVFSSLQSAKVTLVKEIKLSAYTIWEYEQKLQIMDEHIALIEKNIDLSSIYSSSGDASHMEAMSMRLSISGLKIKRDSVSSILDSLYSKISYLSAEDVNFLDIDVQIYAPDTFSSYQTGLKNNKLYEEKLARIEEKSSFVKVKELDSYIDPVLSVGYYYRENQNDYASVSIGASIPIYGSESVNEERARKELMESTYIRDDLYENLNAQLREKYLQLKNIYDTYNTITNESIPELEHMFEISGSMLRSGKNLFLYTDLLEKMLGVYEQKISAIASYKRVLSEIEALQGEMR